MPRSAKDEFTLAAAELMQTHVGQRFYNALAIRTEESREALVMAAPEFIHYSQGAARQGTVLLRLLREAKDDAVKILAAEEAAALKQRNIKP